MLAGCPSALSSLFIGFYLAAEDIILDFLVVLTELRSPIYGSLRGFGLDRSRFRSARHNLPAPYVLVRLLCSRHTSGTVRLPALLTHVLPYAGGSDYTTLHWNLADRPAAMAAAERAAARVERIASALLACGQFVHVCAGQRSSCACRARCAWTRAMAPGARDAYARRAYGGVRRACGVPRAMVVLPSKIAHRSACWPDRC